MQNIFLRRYSIDYLQELISLFGFLWKSKTVFNREQYFCWRYLDNPTSAKQFIFLAFDQFSAIGVRAFVMQNFVFGNKGITVFSPADAVVHPSYRRKGLLEKLNNSLIEEFETKTNFYPSFILNLSSNHLSTAANIKMGWIKTNTKKKYAYRFSILQLLINSIKKFTVNSPMEYFRKENDFYYEISDDFKIENIINLVNKINCNDKITNNRTSEYYKWRYSEPGQIFYFGYAWENDELVALVTFQMVSSTQTVILEYHARSSGLIKKIISLFQKYANIPVIRTMVLASHQQNFLKTCGLVTEPDWLLNLLKIKRLPVLVRPTKSNFSEKDFFMFGKDLRDMENWLLFQADVH